MLNLISRIQQAVCNIFVKVNPTPLAFVRKNKEKCHEPNTSFHYKFYDSLSNVMTKKSLITNDKWFVNLIEQIQITFATI